MTANDPVHTKSVSFDDKVVGESTNMSCLCLQTHDELSNIAKKVAAGDSTIKSGKLNVSEDTKTASSTASTSTSPNTSPSNEAVNAGSGKNITPPNMNVSSYVSSSSTTNVHTSMNNVTTNWRTAGLNPANYPPPYWPGMQLGMQPRYFPGMHAGYAVGYPSADTAGYPSAPFMVMPEQPLPNMPGSDEQGTSGGVRMNQRENDEQVLDMSTNQGNVRAPLQSVDPNQQNAPNQLNPQNLQNYRKTKDKQVHNLHPSQRKTKCRTDRKYKCQVCGFAFATAAGLRFHAVKHGIGDFMYKCPFCDKGVNATEHMKVHLKTHGGSGKEFYCYLCGTVRKGVRDFLSHAEECKAAKANENRENDGQ